MILNPDKPDFVETAVFDEQPPAYDATQSTNYSPTPEKGRQSPTSPSPSGSGIRNASTSTPSPGSASFKSPSSWFSFGAMSRTDREVKATVIGLVRDVVSQPSSASSVSILQSCVEACRARNLAFEAIMQEKSIEGHTPLYWAIVKRNIKNGPPVGQEVGVMDMLLSFPLKEDARSDACEACIIQSDNELYQWLIRSNGWKGRKQRNVEEMLLGEAPNDIIKVQNDLSAADTGAFKAEIHINSFQKRMRVSQMIRLEFIARERMWALMFTREELSEMDYNHKRSGSGYVSIHLMDHSPSTPLRGRITINEAGLRPSDPPVKPIKILLQTPSHRDLSPQSETRFDGIGMSLDEVPGGASLQYDGCSYINEDGSLDLTLEAALTRKDMPECIIM